MSGKPLARKHIYFKYRLIFDLFLEILFLCEANLFGFVGTRRIYGNEVPEATAMGRGYSLSTLQKLEDKTILFDHSTATASEYIESVVY